MARTSRTPVLVELFTSEGCSSCPPADVLLQKLDRSQPVPGADIVVLSEHVDYWNDGGWKRSLFVQGFQHSAERLRTTLSRLTVLTRLRWSWMESAELVGSDEHDAFTPLRMLRKSPNCLLVLSAIHLEGANAVACTLKLVRRWLQEAAVAGKSGSLWRTRAINHSVRHGENAGRNLTHVAVVRKLAKVGDLDRKGSFSGDAKLNADNATTKNLRVIAILQEKNTGRIFGVATGRLSD